MNSSRTTLGVILAIAIVIGISAGIRVIINSPSDSTTLKSDTSQTRASYKKIGMNACVSEAKKGDSGFTDSEVNQYCKCVTDKVYVGTLADMQKMDAEFDKNGFTPAQEQVVLDCAGALYQ